MFSTLIGGGIGAFWTGSGRIAAAFGNPLTLCAGYDNLTWAFDPRRAIALVLLLFLLRAVATVGGLFIAAMVAQLFMRHASGSPIRSRPAAGTWSAGSPSLTAARRTDGATMPPDTDAGRVLLTAPGWQPGESSRCGQQRGPLPGRDRIEDLQAVPQQRWATDQVGQNMRTDVPIAKPHMFISDALTLMEDGDVDLLPVRESGTFIGVDTTTEILKLDEIVDQTNGEP